jgi:hypothetical protein
MLLASMALSNVALGRSGSADPGGCPIAAGRAAHKACTARKARKARKARRQSSRRRSHKHGTDGAGAPGASMPGTPGPSTLLGALPETVSPVIGTPVESKPVQAPPVEKRPPVEGQPIEKPPVEKPPVEKPPVEKPPVEEPPVEEPPVEKPPVEEPPVEKPPVEKPPVEKPPVEKPPVEKPPVEKPPVEKPPVEKPPVEEPPVEKPPVEKPPVEEPPAEKPPVEEPPEPAVEPPPFRLFSPVSVWNAPVSGAVSLDPSSEADVAAFDAEVVTEITKKQLNINTTAWSVPVYTVPAGQPTVKVLLNKLNASANPLQTAWSAVPLPPNAQPAKGTDKHLVVWQPSTDKLWEFWAFENTLTGPVAQWGGAIEHVSTNSGAYDPSAWRQTIPNRTTWETQMRSWGASGCSLSIAGGLITLEDLQRGQIDHALALGIPHTRAVVYASPAQRTDGKSTNPLSLPEGAHLRLDPNLDLTALHLPPMTLMLAKAAQRYGIVVRDTSGNVTFYAQDPTSTGANPYIGPTGYYGGIPPYTLLASFPWSHLQLLPMELH